MTTKERIAEIRELSRRCVEGAKMMRSRQFCGEYDPNEIVASAAQLEAFANVVDPLADVAEAAEEVAQRLKVSCPFCEDDPEAEPDLHKDDCPMYLLNSALAKLAEAGDA